MFQTKQSPSKEQGLNICGSEAQHISKEMKLIKRVGTQHSWQRRSTRLGRNEAHQQNRGSIFAEAKPEMLSQK
jgi:hypothetical protein